MRNGFTFKNRHSSEFDVTVQTQSRPIIPEVKEQTYEVPLMDGEYDFSSANAYGREFYKNRVFKMDIKVIGNNLVDLQTRLAKITVWLRGKGQLVFDDTLNVYWNAHIIDMVDYKPEHGHSTVLSVSFKVDSFAYLTFNVIDGPILDSAVMLGSDIPLDMSEYFTFTGAGQHTVYNIGDVPVRPVITVSGGKGILMIKCKEKTLFVPGNCVINLEKQTVTDNDGRSLMNNVSGTFFELEPGANIISLNITATITVSYEPKYIYNTELEEVILGD